MDILSDSTFGLPGKEAELTAKYPEVQVGRSESDSVSLASAASLSDGVMAASAGTRTSYVRQWWTILGIRYAQAQTTAQYQYSGARAYSIDYCQGTHTNLIPGRQISNWPSSTNNSDGTITCRTNWTIVRYGLVEDTGVQGFRANGYGNFVARWYL